MRVLLQHAGARPDASLREVATAAEADGHAVAFAAGAPWPPPAADLVLIADGDAPRGSGAPTLALLRDGFGPLLQSRARFHEALGCDAAVAWEPTARLLLADLGVALRRPFLAPAEPDGPGGAGLWRAAAASLPALRPTSRDRARDPLISVVMRCGGRPHGLLQRAVASVAAQDAGRFEIVFVRHGPAEPERAVPEGRGGIESVRVEDVAPGSRGEALRAGFAAAAGELLAILDDDDWWLPHHTRWLLPGAAHGTDVSACFAGSGALFLRDARRGLERASAGLAPGVAGVDAATQFPTNGLLFARALAGPFLQERCDFHVGEDTLLIAQLLARASPWESRAGTAVYDRTHEDGSQQWGRDHLADREAAALAALRIAARMGGRLPVAPVTDWWESLRETLSVHAARGAVARLPPLGAPAPGVAPPAAAPRRLALVAEGVGEAGTNCPAPSELRDAATGRAALRGGAPLAHMAYLALPVPPPDDPGLVLECDVEVARGAVALWLYDTVGQRDAGRGVARAGEGRVRIALPVPPRFRGVLCASEDAGAGGSEAELFAVRAVRVLAG